MSNARRKEATDLVRVAERQGFRTKRTKDGTVVYGKDGVGTAMLHFSTSDHRTIRNYRASLKRLGVEI